MHKDKIKKIIRAAVFTAGLCLIVCKLSDIMELKNSRQMYSDFYETEENFDVLFLGTSHVSNGILPLELWNDYGIASYNMSGHGNQLATTYWVLKNALDYTEPKLVFVDCSYLGEDAKTSLVSMNQTHIALDSIPFSINKIKMVNDLFDNAEDKAEFLSDFIIYHGRWSELTKDDFDWTKLSFKGAAPGYEVAVPQVVEKVDEEQKSDPNVNGVVYLRKIIEECQEDGIDVVLTYLPFPAAADKQKESHLANDIAKEYDIPYINFLTMDVTDMDTDCQDPDSHLNISGARKVTDYLGSYIMDNYDIQDHRQDAEYAAWNDEYDNYSLSMTEYLKAQTELKNELMLLANENISTCVYVNGNSPVLADSQTLELIQNVVYFNTDIAGKNNMAKRKKTVPDSMNDEKSECLVSGAAANGMDYFLITDSSSGLVWQSCGNEELIRINTGFGEVNYTRDNDGSPVLIINKENSEDMGNYLTGAGQCNAQIIIIDNITGNIEAVMTF